MLIDKNINIMIIKGYFLHGFVTVLLVHILSTPKGDGWYFSDLVIKVQIHLLLKKINWKFAKG